MTKYIYTLLIFICGSYAADKPNIIYLLVDDLGYADLSLYGQKKFSTPNIDRIGKEGMIFSDHYAGSTVCAPSRAALMTGKHTGHGLVRGNYEVGPHGFGGELPLRPEDLSLAEVMKSAGYRTGLVGKWGMGMDGTTGEPRKKGFDYSYGFLNQAHAHHYYPEYIYKNGEKVMIPENKNGARGLYISDKFAEKGIEFVEENKDKPFFLFWAFVTPHAELLVPEDSLNKFKGKWQETPFVMGKQGGDGTANPFGVYASQNHPRAAFAAMITRLDQRVGELFDKLQELGIDDNTIIMFSSDNGPHKEGGADPDFFDSNGDFSGYKRDLTEGGIRVPFMVRWPAKIKAGSHSNHISAFWDVLPTFADIAKVDSPSDIDGISFLPSLLKQKQKEHDYLYWEFHERGYTEQALRMGKWKALRHGPNTPVVLYDLSKDISEQNDLAKNHHQLRAKITKILDTERSESKLWPLKNR
ncbi:arylsulfatase [Lentisphaera marina]|uniref:arylsulfatase n=1 Tax=Lentisphaera marina TaxID=1111041 RepID=UPI002366C98B|nr:arylsulfatase [Lentisphaera marina]MDD7986169.1 arylsulfatase [Lentisphaera marina]